MAKIADYDMFDYDYSTYWSKREYENRAEKIVLQRMFSSERGFWFLDIGGSYGRLTSTYYDKFSKAIILDYSLKTLQRNKEVIRSKYHNVELIAANAYKLPFRDASIDAGLMVRVLHHIEKPESYFKEVGRVLKNNGKYIQEYPNKMHIKAVIKALLKFDLSFFKSQPYKQPTHRNNEGVQEGVEGIFLNYHPKHIKQMLKENSFKIKQTIGCSYLRLNILKKLFNTDFLLILEKIMQSTLSWSNISPSVFLKTTYTGNIKKGYQIYNDLEDILVCPSCKNDLGFVKENVAICKKCKKEYQKKDNIWDFRVN